MRPVAPHEGRAGVPDDIQDLSFRIQASTLPVDHAEALSAAVLDSLPWIREEPGAAIHLIHTPESGHGWNRPTDSSGEYVYLSRRARLTLRLPKHRLADARQLTQRCLDISGHILKIGEATAKPLTAATTLLSRRVVCDEEEPEELFVTRLADQIQVTVTKTPAILCGRIGVLELTTGKIFTRSVVVAKLEVQDSILLQQKPLGAGRLYGCGLFVPYKEITTSHESG